MGLTNVMRGALLALGVIGCSAAAEQPYALDVAENGAETLGTVRSALGASYAQYYSSYNNAVTMRSWASYEQFCMLSGVRGEYMWTDVDQPNNGDWRVVSDHDESAAWALCFPRSNFTGFANSEFWYTADGDCQTGSRYCWWGDAATAIAGIHGEYNGGGEYVRVSQSTSATSSSSIVPYSSSGSGVYGYGRSIFYGVPGSGRLVRLMGYNTSGASTRGTVLSSGTYLMSVSTYSGYDGYWLAPTDNAFCYFTKLGGEFNGGGEIGRISPSDGWWYLKSISGSGDVWASARCMAWNQG